MVVQTLYTKLRSLDPDIGGLVGSAQATVAKILDEVAYTSPLLLMALRPEVRVSGSFPEKKHPQMTIFWL